MGQKTATANAPTQKVERKRSKTPRGMKVGKMREQLIEEVDSPFRRTRNDYAHHMAQVTRLARML